MRYPHSTVSSFAWKKYGVNWFQLDAPRHYFIHSIESMKHLAKQANFELEDYIYDSTHHQFTISERYKKDKTMNERVFNSWLGKLYHVFQKFVFALKTNKLNTEKWEIKQYFIFVRIRFLHALLF